MGLHRTISQFLKGATALALAAGLAGPAAAKAAAPFCDRACLTGVMQAYLAALVKHSPRGLPVAATLKAGENVQAVKLGDSDAWRQVSRVYPGFLLADPSTGEVISAGAADGPDGVAALLVRLQVKNRRITESEIIFNHGKPGRTFQPEQLIEADLIYDAVVPPPRRSTRAGILRLVDGYLEALSKHDDKQTVFGYRCDRFAMGAKTTNNRDFGSGARPCPEGMNTVTGQTVVNRRFPVIDVARGVGVAMFYIPHNERPPAYANYVGEIFKVVDGKIRSIEEFSIQTAYPPKPVFGE